MAAPKFHELQHATDLEQPVLRRWLHVTVIDASWGRVAREAAIEAESKAMANIVCTKRLPGCDGTFPVELKRNGRECPSCYRTRKAEDVKRWRERSAVSA